MSTQDKASELIAAVLKKITPQEQPATITIGKRETVADLGGLAPEEVCCLQICSDHRQASLDLLAAYPNVTRLALRGAFSNVDAISGLRRLRSLDLSLSAPVDFSGIHGPSLKSLSASGLIDGSLSTLLTGGVENLELLNIRGLADLSFVEQAVGLKKLYLCSLPAAERLPDFEKTSELYALKVYELHKLNDVEGLARSAIRYLDLALAADKLSGTRLAQVLLRMEHLQQADLFSLDRSGARRFTVIENQFKKVGKETLLQKSFDMREWTLL